MLSSSARPYIDASVLVLREHGLTITKRFYAQLFEAQPELKNLFNMGNQESGAQQGALAAAVLAYAANIDNAAALAPVIDRIAHKHASVGITSAQYPSVGRHLLGAIKDVLGEAATPDLLAAWDEAYWLLAGELIAAEARLYERAAVDAGTFRELRVSAVRQESEDVASFYLQAPDGGSPGPFAPGQYVSVEVALAERGLRQLRQYSLSDAASRPYWRITVKREAAAELAPAGLISNHLHAQLKQGDLLRVSAPFGNFTPLAATSSPERPLVLLSAGVGITPLNAVLQTLAEQQSERAILFAHAARDARHHPLRAEIEQARARLPHLRTLTFYEQLDGGAAHADLFPGRMALTEAQLAPFRDADHYLCGPLPFMQEQWRALLALGISPARIQREVFGPELLDHLL